jgi:ferredoxin
MSTMHRTVDLATQVGMEKTGAAKEETDATRAFRQTGRPPKGLYEQALGLRKRFVVGGWVFGAFVGLVVGLKLLKLSIKRKRTDYETDRAYCVSCARCFEYCPYEHIRRGTFVDVAALEAAKPGPSPQEQSPATKQKDR